MLLRTYNSAAERNRRVVLGNVDNLTPQQARERCQTVLGNVARGHPVAWDQRQLRNALGHGHKDARLNLFYELGLELHSPETLDLAVDVVIALDQSDALHLGAGL